MSFSHISVHIRSDKRVTTVIQPRRPDGTFRSPVASAAAQPLTAHVADYLIPSQPRFTRTRLR